MEIGWSSAAGGTTLNAAVGVEQAEAALGGEEGLEDRTAPAAGADLQRSFDRAAYGQRGRFAPAPAPAPPPAIEWRLRRALAETSFESAPLGSSCVPALSCTSSRSAVADAEVLARLDVALSAWVDESKARHYADSPSDLLQAVARHRRRIVPDAFTATLDPSLL
ncbi:hypothetical protein C0Z18_10930 [Trinickia dabaoshanensis]|uniref:Uncharacterized protein n=1 Tax=Trinickia dabaoshanensis TaxID=564714 RepID=A0A2N7VTI2_9BURK|nr:hypothetical protein [Trinickia dabaoshanensis]PMS20445.1 hypothetical protein C0Z18_10930 [Trinickia dabaoshanensis]